MLEFLASLADNGRVNDRHHLFEVIHDHAVEEVFISVLQRDQVQVFLEVGRLRVEVAEDPKLLFGHRVDTRR